MKKELLRALDAALQVHTKAPRCARYVGLPSIGLRLRTLAGQFPEIPFPIPDRGLCLKTCFYRRLLARYPYKSQGIQCFGDALISSTSSFQPHGS